MLTHPKGVHCPAPPALSLRFRWPSRPLSDSSLWTFSCLSSLRRSYLFGLRMFDTPTELALSLRAFCASTGCPVVDLLSLVHQMSSSGSSLPPFLVPTLPHAFSSETKLWKRGVSSLAALLNPHRRVRSRQLNSCELDVTSMRSSDCADGLRSWAWSRGNKETKQSFLQNPLTAQMGDERITGKEEYVLRSQVRNVQPPSYEQEYP